MNWNPAGGNVARKARTLAGRRDVVCRSRVALNSTLVRKILLLVAMATVCVHPLPAQSVRDIGRGRLEVIGLRRWTIPMIQDSLARYAPGVDISSSACAAVLRYRLGFADAAVVTYMGWPLADTAEYVVVTVVEPQDSARVRHRVMPMDTTAPLAAWAKAISVATSRPDLLQQATEHYIRSGHPAIPDAPSPSGPDAEMVAGYVKFLADHRTEGDLAAARSALQSSPDYRTRAVAASIMANFIERDSTLNLLMDVVRESDGMAAGTADVVLASMAATSPRKVDWSGASYSIHAILDGTKPFQLSTVIRTLVATGVGPADAGPMLKDGGRMLLAYAGAAHPPTRDAALALLRALAGRDLGAPVAWQAWIEGL